MIEKIVRDTIDIKNQYETIKDEYQKKRDELRNAIVNSGENSIEILGYKITITPDLIYMTINKKAFFDALDEAGVSQATKSIIMNGALIEQERVGSVRIEKI
jgi:hypothetical protein